MPIPYRFCPNPESSIQKPASFPACLRAMNPSFRLFANHQSLITDSGKCYDFAQKSYDFCYDFDLNNHSVLPTLLRCYDFHGGSPSGSSSPVLRSLSSVALLAKEGAFLTTIVHPPKRFRRRKMLLTAVVGEGESSSASPFSRFKVRGSTALSSPLALPVTLDFSDL
jgi:hypothetical protein